MEEEDEETKQDECEENESEEEVESPWTMKYQPQQLSEVVGNSDVIQRLCAVAEAGTVNLILCGPSGCGKTMCMELLARELLGVDFERACLQTCASLDKGLINQIQPFSEMKCTLPSARHKLVLIDEAETTNKSVQHKLRRLMEKTNKTTRFILTCNDFAGIDESLAVKCAVLKFQTISDSCMISRLEYILQQEQVLYTKKGLESIAFFAEGDVRAAINLVQAVAFQGEVNEFAVAKIMDQPPPLVLETILLACVKCELGSALEKLGRLHDQGYSAEDLIGTMWQVVTRMDVSCLFLQIIVETKQRILEGLDTWLQLTGCVARLCSLYPKKK